MAQPYDSFADTAVAPVRPDTVCGVVAGSKALLDPIRYELDALGGPARQDVRTE